MEVPLAALPISSDVHASYFCRRRPSAGFLLCLLFSAPLLRYPVTLLGKTQHRAVFRVPRIAAARFAKLSHVRVLTDNFSAFCTLFPGPTLLAHAFCAPLFVLTFLSISNFRSIAPLPVQPSRRQLTLLHPPSSVCNIYVTSPVSPLPATLRHTPRSGIVALNFLPRLGERSCARGSVHNMDYGFVRNCSVSLFI